MAKVLFFTKSEVPTAAEKTAIGRLEAAGYSVGVRNASVDTKHGSKIETCDAVAAILVGIPTAYQAKSDVTPTPVAKPEKLQVLPATKAITHPGTQQLQVLKAEQDESTKAITISDVTASSAGTTYASSAESKATVSEEGLVTSVAAGTANITATYTSVAAVKASLACADVPTKQYDAVLEAHTAGAAGNDYKFALVAGESAGIAYVAGTKTVTATFVAGTTTVADVNTLIGTLAGGDDVIDVKTAGTEARKLDANAAFPAQSLSGGAAAVTSTAVCAVTVS